MAETQMNQLAKLTGAVAQVGANEFTAIAAMKGMEDLLKAQRDNWMITFRTYYSRISIRGQANQATGLVENPSYNFFATGEGQTGAGFARTLTDADISIATSASLPANYIFIADEFMLRFGSGMPLRTQVAIAERGFIRGTRGNVNTNFGRPLDYPCPLGIFVSAASTTVAQTTIAAWGNGPTTKATALPRDGRVYFPAKQQIKYTLQVNNSFYATTDGLPLSNTGSNYLIPNDGGTVGPELIGESPGYIEMLLRGYEIVQPG